MSIREWIPFFLTWGAPCTAYVVIQVIAAVRLRGKYRLICLVPVLPMLVVGALTVSAYRQQSNLWPILLIFAGPVAFLFVAGVWIAFRRARRASDV